MDGQGVAVAGLGDGIGPAAEGFSRTSSSRMSAKSGSQSSSAGLMDEGGDCCLWGTRSGCRPTVEGCEPLPRGDVGLRRGDLRALLSSLRARSARSSTESSPLFQASSLSRTLGRILVKEEPTVDSLLVDGGAGETSSDSGEVLLPTDLRPRRLFLYASPLWRDSSRMRRDTLSSSRDSSVSCLFLLLD